MKSIFLALLGISLLQNSTFADPACGDWEPYKDEKCIKVIDETKPYDDAVKLCQVNEPTSTLLSIGSPEEQTFMENLLFKTHKVLDAVWLGARLASNKYKWTGDLEMKWTNWTPGMPTNKTDYVCVQMIDQTTAGKGKWANEPCGKKNLVVCQKAQTWSIAKLQQILLDTRKQLQDTEKELANAKQELANTKQEHQTRFDKLEKNPVPIGFIYVQLSNLDSPKTIWPTLTWQDVSSTYAGLFFRVEGGGSASFGSVQNDTLPYIDMVKYFGECERYEQCQIGYKGGWSGQVNSGIFQVGPASNCLTFHMTADEVRPRNMAMRIWKRVG